MATTEKKINLYEYCNYRDFLRDFYQLKKRQSPHAFSFRIFSERAGLGSPNYLKLIMEGQRNLSPKMVPRFAEALKLDARQKRFFEALVRFTQATTAEEKDAHFGKLLAFKECRKATLLRNTQYEYLSHWYYVAIREMAALPDFKGNPKIISNQLNPPISEAQAKEALKVLLDLGLLVKGPGGGLRANAVHLTTEETTAALSAYHFHKQMIERSLAALNEPSEEREISSITLALPRQEMGAIKGKIHRFIEELQAWLETLSTASDEIYQLNFQLFRLTHMRKHQKEKR